MTVEEAAWKAVRACEKWADAEGAFPEPEYDDFIAAMNALKEALAVNAKPSFPRPD